MYDEKYKFCYQYKWGKMYIEMYLILNNNSVLSQSILSIKARSPLRRFLAAFFRRDFSPRKVAMPECPD